MKNLESASSITAGPAPEQLWFLLGGRDLEMVAIRELLDEIASQEFRDRVTELQVTFLKFCSRSWFAEVSNQLQADEIFRWWRDVVGNQRLFEEVDAAHERVYTALTEHHARSIAWYSFSATVLNVFVAIVALVIAIVALVKHP